jgi:hypothetical protein
MEWGGPGWQPWYIRHALLIFYMTFWVGLLWFLDMFK